MALITITHDEYIDKGRYHEVVDAVARIDYSTVSAMKQLASRYKTNLAGMAALALNYYFGDGNNHLHCDFCSQGADCLYSPAGYGDEGHATILDNGSVVVGHPLTELGE